MIFDSEKFLNFVQLNKYIFTIEQSEKSMEIKNPNIKKLDSRKPNCKKSHPGEGDRLHWFDNNSPDITHDERVRRAAQQSVFIDIDQ